MVNWYHMIIKQSSGLSPFRRHYLDQFDGLVQERRNSSALAMELRLSFTIPSSSDLSSFGSIDHIVNAH